MQPQAFQIVTARIIFKGLENYFSTIKQKLYKHVKLLNMKNARARERAQCLRTLTGLPEDLGVRLSTHKAAYSDLLQAEQLNSSGFCTLGSTDTCGAQTFRQVKHPIHKEKIKEKNEKLYYLQLFNFIMISQNGTQNQGE